MFVAQIPDETGGAFNASNFIIVLSSNSVDWKINLRNGAKILEIEEIRHPWSFNAKTPQADISILKLAQPITCIQTVKSICYLWKKFNNFPQVNSTGTVAGFRVTETGEISQNLKYVNLNVLPFEDYGETLPEKFCAKSTKGELIGLHEVQEFDARPNISKFLNTSVTRSFYGRPYKYANKLFLKHC
ncbi:unnamed protein product [Allacma fusca]|uniref:Peptidase S1 domain-containing protein n=1 Tax=Allacma fusca TaxID=39272 RepID=A0A8J2JMM7_9HEXA|nr:unnamed protein product [Allacma fusca]